MTIAEIEQMPINEFHEWAAYFKIMSEKDG
jgi:hypothetical protein